MQIRNLIPALSLTVATLVGSSSVEGQPSSLREGARLKVSSSTQKDMVGVVQAATPDTLVLFAEPHGARLAVTVPSIQKVQVSRGRLASEGAKKGLLWGGVVGLASSAIILAAGGDEALDEPGGRKVSKGSFAAQNFVGSLIFGAGIGALVKADKWDTVPFRAGVSAASGGISIRISSAFR